MVPQAVFHPSIRRAISWPLLGRSLVLLALAIPAIAVQAETPAANSAEVELGRRIYMEEFCLRSAFKGKRASSGQIEGAAAACETCHRRSGMGVWKAILW